MKKLYRQTFQNTSNLMKHVDPQSATRLKAEEQRQREKIQYGRVVSTKDERLELARAQLKSYLDTSDVEKSLTEYEAEDLTHTKQSPAEKYAEKPQDKRTITAIEKMKEGEIDAVIEIAQELRKDVQTKQEQRKTLPEEKWEAKSNLTGEIRTLVSDLKILKKALAQKLLSIAAGFIEEVKKDETKRPNATAEIKHVEEINNADFGGKLLDDEDKAELVRLQMELSNINDVDEDV